MCFSKRNFNWSYVNEAIPSLTHGSSGAMSPLESKETKGDEGTEGGHKFGKMGRRRLWMVPKV